MFANLIESASHQQDLARKGRFFLATLISYAVIVACAGLASIYAYDAHVENQELEFLGLVPPIVPEAKSPEPKSVGPKAKNNAHPKNAVPERTIAIERVDSGTKVPDAISAIKSDIAEIPLGRFKIGLTNTDLDIGGPVGDHTGEGPGGGGDGGLVKMDTAPPQLRDNASSQPKKETIKSGGVVNGNALFLPKPEYTAIAKAARAAGPVNVQVLIDETGKVISARATFGNPLLRKSAEVAAYRTRFSPTLLSGVPVKVSGVINYNFSLQ